MASSSCSRLSFLILLTFLLHLPSLSTQLHVSSSVINIAKLTLLCGTNQQETGIDQQDEGEAAVPPGAVYPGIGTQEKGAAGGVRRQWLRFLESLRSQQTTGLHPQQGVQVPPAQPRLEHTQDGEREDPEGESPASDGSTVTAPGGVPAFLRAVRIGHVMSDAGSQATDFWNMTAVKGQEDGVHEGEYTFNLHFIHALHHRYAEVVFSPTNYQNNGSQICTFIFCNDPKTICATLDSNVSSNGSLFHTEPTRFVFGTVISSFPEGIVKLVSVTCGQTKIQMDGNNRRPLLAFFQTKRLADTVNTFALAGWQQLDDHGDVGNTGERKRRSTESTAASSSKGRSESKEMADKSCRRHTWTVTAKDLGWEGEMIEPLGVMEIGYCHGDCSNQDKPAHAILRVHYINSVEYMAKDVIQPPSCVPTSLLPRSAVLRISSTQYALKILPSIKVTQCECR